MFSEIIQPRFSETDALGHINNTVFAVWFEGARTALFRIFTPELNLKQWPLIIARVSIDYHAQTQYGEPVEIRTFISRLGGSSFDVYQQAWQNGIKCATGTTVMVQFDYQHQQARALTEQQKTTLSQHLFVPIDR
ncbi:MULTISPECIES: acyl-CoA thioesterase [unclassified Arsukibacterium]|uniref:acyl-CoA thioesterase n=1 Tax=unclassified Arsukibacterium TaxID=2635278 RepID=UPI000C67D8BC|nr:MULTISPECIES: thioesterase family protein [unclassified Arsukibacterium]MAA93690.1 thioesterase [Rheinheimera sp.]MBM33074.1 thioesterase [Rheinheimera sp.]HAW93082.1 thioesterase [Candidatus Azambacteria bacterium]|tara:strand:+ start:52213 stop:52617 length:405 start_codon:yes stop_codon:yes gene_type:complete